jgi:hypothetical protein
MPACATPAADEGKAHIVTHKSAAIHQLAMKRNACCDVFDALKPDPY